MNKINIQPKINKNIFTRNSMDCVSLLKEFIDNTVAEMKNTPNGFVTKIEIILRANWDGAIADISTANLIIRDNSVGISKQKLSECLQIGKEEGNIEHSLHEHGCGMKIAIWSIGDLFYLISKNKDDKYAIKINDLPVIGDVNVIDTDWCFSEEFKTGTEICICNLNKEKASLLLRKSDITTWVIPQLSAIYSKLFNTNQFNNKRLEISFIIQNLEGIEEYRRELNPLELFYRNGKKDLNIEIDKKELNYTAFFEGGIAASDCEYEQYNEPVRGPNNPHHPWAKKINIIINDRIICRKSLEELINPHVDENEKFSGNYMVPYQGELILRKGFKTTLFKDDIEPDENYVHLIRSIAARIKNFISQEANKAGKHKKQENEYNRDLCKILNASGLLFADSHRKVEICNGEIDIVLYDKPKEKLDLEKDKAELYELKVEEADALTCYQILMYLENCNSVKKDKATIIAPSFSQGCKNTIIKFKKEKGIDINMKTYADYGLPNPDLTKKTRNKKKKKS